MIAHINDVLYKYNIYIYILYNKLLKEKNETFHFVKYFGIAFGRVTGKRT